MARRSSVYVGLALALICVVNHQGHAANTCRTGCQGAASHTLKYQEGNTYKYNFDSKILVSLSSAEDQQSTTEVKASVLVTSQADCNQIIRLQNVQIISNDGKKHTQIPDIDKAIRVNSHDGRLGDSICITPGDNQNSLNLKRAIASIFQVNLNSGHETDVFGVCPTEVTQHKEGNVLIVQKTRNLNRCSYRENIKQDFLTTAFNLNSEIKSSPILSGDYDAKIKIKNGILDHATINEHYLYVPFSVRSNGAKASVETTIKYVGTSKDNPTAKVSEPRSIIFEDPHPVNSPHANVNTILNAVKQVAKTIDATVGENTAKEFTNLVRALRVSKKDDLLAVYNQIRAGVGFSDKTVGKRIFLDALLRASNGDNVEVAIELLKNKELNEIEQHLVYIGLSNVRHATENSIKSATTLLNQANVPRSAYLGIGNLAGRYCRQHSCENVEAINKLIQKLAQKLNNGKASNKEEENNIVYLLKALGNIHYLSNDILSKLTSIAQDKKTPNRLRVAALETYLADACKDKLRDSALSILKDIQQDSEIRIKAYLVVAQCPNTKVANAIKALLETEPSYQVGGFIASHIRNIRASANPDKQLAKQHLGLINISKRFPIDLRKYSANGEFSYTIDSLGIANSIESNVIYSQDSFLPRSTSLNLTAEVFGHNLNFLEIETRQENLDHLVEHYFGPRGLFRANSLQDLWNTKGKQAEKVVQELKERLNKSLRARRDVTKAEIDQIGKQVAIRTNQLNTDLDLDISIKTFGSELIFLNINDDIKKFTPESIIDKIVDGFNEGLDKLKHFDQTLQSNVLFLDAEFAYPTSAGFPLRLGVEGASNVQVKAAGSIDIRALLSGENTLTINLIPSANVEVAGRLTIDTQVFESGLKVISNLHTATGGDLVAEIHKNSIDVKFKFPVKKQILVSASHNIVFHTREAGNSEVNVPLKFAQNKDFSVCLDQLNQFIGLTFCAEFTGPNLQGQKVPILPFPLSGDAKVAVTIDREDLSEYHFKDIFHDSKDKLGGEIVLEALDKNHQKKASLTLEALLHPEKVVRASLTSPVTSVLLEGRIIDTKQEKSIALKFLQDKNEYSAKIGVDIQGSPQKSVYKPIIEYKTPQNNGVQASPYRVEGQIIVEHNSGSTYTLDNVKLIIPNAKTISVNGKLGTQPETVFAEITISDGTNNANFNGKLRVNPNLIKYNAELKNSLSPQGNVHVKGELTKSNEEIKSLFQLAHGGDLSNKNNILTLENSLKYRNKGPQDFVLDTKNKLTYPAFSTSVKLDFDLKPNAVAYTVDIQYTNVKLGSELDWQHTTKKEGTDFKLKLGLWGLNNNIKLKSKRQVVGEQSQIENALEINGKLAELNGKIKHHIKPHDIDVAADLIVKVPTHNAAVNIVSGLRVNANEIDISHKVSSGSTVFVDVFLKANRGGNANGSLKISLKEQIVANGQLKANKGSGNGNIVIELPSLERSTKIDTTFTVHAPNYNVVVNIYPITKDPTKKITLSTHTSITEHSLDSKNFIDVFGDKLETNIKGTQHGALTNGKTTGDIEISLPNQQYIALKLNRELKDINHVLSGNVVASIEHRSNKNQPGNKISLKGQLKNTKPNEKLFDISYQLSAETSTGRNVNIDLSAKRQPSGDATVLEINKKISGSELPSPIETTIKSSCKGTSGSFELESNYAKLGKVSVVGKHDLSGAGKPLSGSVKIDISTTSKELSTLKIEAGGSLLKTKGVVVDGSLNILANNPSGVILELDTKGNVKVEDNDSRVKGSLKTGKLDPISIDVGISRKDDKDQKQVHGDILVTYGQNQKIKGDINLHRLSSREHKLDATLNTPFENFKSNKIQAHVKHNEDKTRYQSDSSITSNDKTWTLTSDIQLSENTPSIEIKAICPQKKLQHLLIKVNKLGNHQLSAQLKVINEAKNFLLESAVDANVESIDDFHLKLTANCPSLKIDKYVVEAVNKPAKTGRRIQINAKTGNKNVLSGSTSYVAREEQGKLIVEGSGSFKLHDQTQGANFKFIRQNLSQTKDGEAGIEITFDAGLGNKAIDAELKVTNKQFRILKSYCEEKKQCAHIEVDIKTSTDSINHFNQEIEIAIDLRKLGLSHEFGLKAVTTRKDYLLDHTVDVHFQSQENSKYQYSLYLHPKEAGVSLTTPKRIISLEANVKIPQDILQKGGRLSGDVILYLDKKNKPNVKTAVHSFLDFNAQSQSLTAEVKFNNPVLKRALVYGLQSKATPNDLNVVLTADIFVDPSHKIILSYTSKWSDIKNWKAFETSDNLQLKSAGLGLELVYDSWFFYSVDDQHFKRGAKFTYSSQKGKYNSVASYDLSPKKVEVTVDLLNSHILKVISKLELSKEHQSLNSEIIYCGQKAILSNVDIKNLNTLKISLAQKDKPQDQLQINAGFIPGQIADVRAELLKNGAKQELAHGTVKLDDANFLKSDYKIASKNIDALGQSIKKRVEAEGNELKKLSDKLAKQLEDELNNLGEIAKVSAPDVKPIAKYYVNELNIIKDEILADKTVKEASEFLYNILSAISHAFGESFARFSELVENVAKSLQNSFGSIINSIKKDILPNIKTVGDKLINLFIHIVDTSTNIVLVIGTKLAEIAEKYRPELQQLSAVLGEVSQDLFKSLFNVYEAVKNVIIEQWQQIYNEIKTLPAFKQLCGEYENLIKNGLPKPEALANGIKDLLFTLKDIVPTPELKELVQALSDYITQILTNQKVDDKKAVERIIKAAVASGNQIIGGLLGHHPTPEFGNVKFSIPSSIWNRIPRLAAVKFSPLSLILEDDLQIPSEFLLSIFDKPRNWIPPFPLHGVVAQGQHIFTFDGKHLTFPGKCNYLLARDAVDGNFTVIGSYNNGLLEAITLNQGSDTITLKKTGSVLVNNAASELPARKTHVAAYRYSSTVTLASDYGIKIICGPELIVCSITTSGFYHGKVKGLLGNGNNEPYDDFKLPNGKIVTSESEFGNSYATSSGCAKIQTVSHDDHHASPTCDKLFGWESSLKLCYPFVSNNNFKMACEHGVAAGVKKTEEAIAIAYVAACKHHNIPIELPSEFVKCTNGDKSFEVGDQFSVKTPGKAADIVVLVDTVKENEATYKEYVQPLIQQLSTELNSKGINDIEFHLIAYGGENQWPSHITTSGGKLTFKGKAPNLKFSENPKEATFITGCPQLDTLIHTITNIGHDVKLALGLDLQAITYSEGLQYPFRAHAVKSLIAVTSKPCQTGQLYSLLRTLLYRSHNINLNLITPISRDGAKTEAKNIVGFNSQDVWALGQTKNKIKGFSDLDKELTYNDFCIDFIIQNDGNVFVSDHIHLQPKATKKQFVQLTSHGIVEQLLSTERNYDCECKFTSPYGAANVCKLVSSKEKTQGKKVGTKS